jgi:hypothetical protein
MKRSLLAMALLLACDRRSVPSLLDAGSAGEPRPGQPDGGVVLTLAKLDAFLTYERALRALPAASTAELRRLSTAADAGPQALEDAYALLRRRAGRIEELRKAAGLGTQEVQTLEALTADVAFARAGSGGAELGRAIEELAGLKDALPQDQRAAIERTLTRLRQDEARASTLSEVRATWGDAWVDLVLQREAAVLEVWNVAPR